VANVGIAIFVPHLSENAFHFSSLILMLEFSINGPNYAKKLSFYTLGYE
jgi:hypothetical protein